MLTNPESHQPETRICEDFDNLNAALKDFLRNILQEEPSGATLLEKWEKSDIPMLWQLLHQSLANLSPTSLTLAYYAQEKHHYIELRPGDLRLICEAGKSRLWDRMTNTEKHVTTIYAVMTGRLWKEMNSMRHGMRAREQSSDELHYFRDVLYRNETSCDARESMLYLIEMATAYPLGCEINGELMLFFLQQWEKSPGSIFQSLADVL